MKGVKYNIKLKEEKNQFREYRELTMKDAIKKKKSIYIFFFLFLIDRQTDYFFIMFFY